MVSEKVVAVMLVLAIVISAISIVITLNVNSNINNTGSVGSLSKQGNAGNVQLVVEPNSAGAGAGGGSIEG